MLFVATPFLVRYSDPFNEYVKTTNQRNSRYCRYWLYLLVSLNFLFVHSLVSFLQIRFTSRQRYLFLAYIFPLFGSSQIFHFHFISLCFNVLLKAIVHPQKDNICQRAKVLVYLRSVRKYVRCHTIMFWYQ